MCLGTLGHDLRRWVWYGGSVVIWDNGCRFVDSEELVLDKDVGFWCSEKMVIQEDGR